MDYGALISRAWRLTWHNRFLWVLGLFATSSVGSCSPVGTGNGPVQWRADPIDVERFFSADLVRAFQQADPWLSQNIGWFLLSLVILVFLSAIAFLIVSLIAQGGMAEGTMDLALGHTTSARTAWGSGLRMVWRYLLLWLLLLGLVLLVMLGFAVLIGIGVAVGMATQGAPRTALIVLGGILSLVVLVILLPLFVASSVVVAFAQRAIAIENAGPWHAIQIALRVTRRNLGTSLLSWLLSFALSLGTAMVVLLAGVVLLIPLGALGVAIFYATGAIVSIPLASYAVLAALAIIVVLWFAGGVANAFFWNFWTLTYLYLTGRLTNRLEPPAP